VVRLLILALTANTFFRDNFNIRKTNNVLDNFILSQGLRVDITRRTARETWKVTMVGYKLLNT